ncbi:hypothetical protein GCM10023332_14580 [Luteimonas vadosa]|uniref:Uncharacterized protein n=1 Tax=Luteimonas vadosa TaxID=1165507 RepID=A0ABP9DY01_9GAMM
MPDEGAMTQVEAIERTDAHDAAPGAQEPAFGVAEQRVVGPVTGPAHERSGMKNAPGATVLRIEKDAEV